MADMKIALKISADGSQAQAEIVNVGRSIHGLETSSARATGASDGLASAVARVAHYASGAVLALGGLAVLKDVAAYYLRSADAAAQFEARMRLTEATLGSSTGAFEALARSARATGTAFADSVSLYQGIARVAPELGASTGEVLRMVESLQKLGKVSGASQEAMSNAMLQLSQALGGGVMRAEEFNSVLENTPEIATAIAKGMGLTVGELRAAVNDGKVLSEDVLAAVLKQSVEIDEKFSKIPPSLSGSATAIEDAMAHFIGQLDESVGLSRTLAGWMQAAADALGGVGTLQGELEGLKEREADLLKGATTRWWQDEYRQRLADVRQEIELVNAMLDEQAVNRTRGVTGEVGERQTLAAKKAQEEMQKLVDKTTADLSRQIDTFGQVGKAAALRYELEKGALKDLQGPQREQIQAQIAQLEKLEQSKAAAKGAAGAKRELSAANKQAATAAEAHRKALEREVADLDRLRKKYDTVYASQEAYKTTQSELKRLYDAGLISLERYTDALGEFLDAQEGMDTAVSQSVAAVTEMQDQADPYAEAWKNALQRVDDAFAGVWSGAFEGFAQFRDALGNAFKQMLAELAHAAITRPIMLSIGATMGITGSGAATAGGSVADLMAGGSSGNPFSSLLSNVFGYGVNYAASLIGGAGSSQAALLASQTGAFGLDGANLTYGALTGGSGLTGLGAAGFGGLGAGALLGGQLGAKYGGPVGAGIGSALGGLGGVALTGGVGAMLGGGSFLAGAGGALAAMGPVGWAALAVGAIASVLGASKSRPDDNIVGAIGAGGERLAFRPGSPDDNPSQETQDALSDLLDGTSAFVRSIEASGGALARHYAFSLGAQGLGMEGVDGQFERISGDADQALAQIFRTILSEASGVSDVFRQIVLAAGDSGEVMLRTASALAAITDLQATDVVQAARDAYANAKEAETQTLSGLYTQQTEALRGLIAEYDGSLEASEGLAAAYAEQKASAYQLASALLSVSGQIDVLFGDLAETIRQDLMSEGELYEHRRQQVDALVAAMSVMTDPAQLMQTAQQIEQLTSQMWQSLDEAQKAELGGDFLGFLDQINRLAQERIGAGLDQLGTDQSEIGDSIDVALEGAAAAFATAATQQESAATSMESAATRVADAAQSILSAASALSDIRITVDLPFAPEVGA